MAAEGRVDITVKAHDKTGGVFQKIGGSLKSLGKIAATATAAAGVAVGGLAAKGIKDFADFQEGMNEVFTLMPNISEEAMGAMSAQVKDLSKDMGVLPEEVVPALYQSISAGVPQDNVFEFLETAQKAAVGGVTDLETAVDGISSTVNAYGRDVISAGEASDVMFTAVRLGKTTFGELSDSLADVNPLAAGLGVKFPDVAAGLAAMTSQGTKTNKATTQMRALLQELGTAGTEVFGIFEEAAGTTFPEFIAEGGDMGGAMAILRDVSAETGEPIQDMFGNVRAGLAALQLGGEGFETFTDNLKQAQDASGATDAAFERMNTSFKRVVERIQASVKVALLDLGQAFLPVLEKVAELAEKWLPILSDKAFEVASTIGQFVRSLLSGEDPINSIANLVAGLATNFGATRDQARAVYDWIINVGAAIQGFIEQAQAILTPIIEWIAQFVSLKDVLIAVGIVLGVVVVGAVLTLMQTLLPLIAVGAALVASVALVRNAWENNWLGIRDKVKVVVTFLKNFLLTAIQNIRTWWEANGEQILATAQRIWETIQSTIQTIITIIRTILNAVMAQIRASWNAHGASILASAQNFWDAVRGYIDRVIGRIRDLIDRITSVILGLWERHGASLIEGAQIAWDTIKELIDNSMANISTLLDAFAAVFSGDWKMFLAKIKALWKAGWENIKLVLRIVKETIGRIVRAIAEEILQKLQDKVDEVRGRFEDDFATIKGVVDGAKEAISNFWGKIKAVYDWLKNKVFKVNISGPVGALLGAPGNQGGTQFFPGGLTWVGEAGPELVSLPRGSRIFSNGASRNLMRDMSRNDNRVVNNYFTIHATYEDRVGDPVQDIKTLQMLRG